MNNNVSEDVLHRRNIRYGLKLMKKYNQFPKHDPRSKKGKIERAELVAKLIDIENKEKQKQAKINIYKYEQARKQDKKRLRCIENNSKKMIKKQVKWLYKNYPELFQKVEYYCAINKYNGKIEYINVDYEHEDWGWQQYYFDFKKMNQQGVSIPTLKRIISLHPMATYHRRYCDFCEEQIRIAMKNKQLQFYKIKRIGIYR